MISRFRARRLTILLLFGLSSFSFVSPAVAEEEEIASKELSVSVDHGLLRLQVHELPLAVVLVAVAERAGFRLKLKGDLSAPVSWHFAGVPLDEGLRRLVGKYGLVLNYNSEQLGASILKEVVVLGVPNGRVAIFVPTIRKSPLETIYAQLENRDRVSRLGLVRELASAEDDSAIEDLITILADEKDTVVRRMAVIALGKIGGERALEVLSASLDDELPLIRRQATRALGTLGDEASHALLRAVRDNKASVRVQAARALAQFPTDNIVYALRDVLIDDPDPKVRFRAVQSLAEHNTALALSIIQVATTDPDPSVREAAVRAMDQSL